MTPLQRLHALPRPACLIRASGRRPSVLWLLTAGLLGVSAGASAQSSGAPWYLGAALSQQYANNVFRENSAENSDQYTTLTLLGARTCGWAASVCMPTPSGWTTATTTMSS